MEHWTDQGIVLSARAHGEGGAVVVLLTENKGRHAGYLYGARSSEKRALIEPGTRVFAQWKARLSENLGTWALEESGYPSPSGRFLHDGARLAALASACALCEASLPDREGHSGLFHGLQTLFTVMEEEIWREAYILWELALLSELGFGLDLTRCAAGGDSETLAYVSPKTGRAVSLEAGEPYKDRLLPLPEFLKPGKGDGPETDSLSGLDLTGYFLENRVFAHSSSGLPDARRLLRERWTPRAVDACSDVCFSSNCD